MRDRLIELIKIAKKNTKGANSDLERNMLFAESLLANGVIVPPCKVGDAVYTYGARRVKEWVITFCGINSRGEYYFRAVDDGFKNLLEFWNYEISVRIFLTKEEAEEKLKELNK